MTLLGMLTVVFIWLLMRIASDRYVQQRRDNNMGRLKQVKSAASWAKFLYTNYEFDYSYLLRIMKRKLELMEENFNEDGMTISAPKQAKDMHIAILLLDRILADDYNALSYNQHERKWGELKLHTDDGHLTLRCTRVTEETNKQESKEFMRICRHADYMKKQDVRYLFNFIGKHILTWWW